MTWSHYTDVSNDPAFPFGFGLSYSTFTYTEPRLSAAAMDATSQLEVTVTVCNTGTRPGTEIVQLYVRDLVGSVTRPVKELKGFRKVDLGPGSRGTSPSRFVPPTSRSTRRAGAGRPNPAPSR